LCVAGVKSAGGHDAERAVGELAEPFRELVGARVLPRDLLRRKCKQVGRLATFFRVGQQIHEPALGRSLLVDMFGRGNIRRIGLR
jgi:hypothetical protein